MALDFFQNGEAFFDQMTEFFDKVRSLSVGFFDILDILLVAVAVYYLLNLLKGSRARHLMSGLIVLGVLYALVTLFGLAASSYILKIAFSNIFLLLIIIFQQEIRQIIERLGRKRIGDISFLNAFTSGDTEKVNLAIIEICKAVQRMSASKTGALIVFEKDTIPSDVVESGTIIDAEISHELIGNIFYPKSPLHDGAAIIRNGKLLSAGCVLPLTTRQDIPSEYGTRHRAGIGMSENSNALVIVVSEETGQISIMIDGKLKVYEDESTLRAKVIDYMIERQDNQKQGFFSKFSKKGNK